MKKLLAIAAAVILLSTGSPLALAQTSNTGLELPLPQNAVMSLDANVSDAGIDEFVLVTYPTVSVSSASIYKTEAPLMTGKNLSVSVMTKSDALLFASRTDGVVIETDSEIHKAETVSSPSWHLDRIDQNYLPLDSKYSFGTSGKGVRIYVVDSGVRPSNPEVRGRVEVGTFNYGVGYSSDDCEGHGTSVASVAAGATLGVAKNATVVPVRVLDCNGSGRQIYAIQALNWIISNHPGGPAVINMSLGGEYSYSYNAAVQSAIDRGFTVVVAAGNESIDACGTSPASSANAITVGATDRYDYMSSFSNHGSCVDIYAPGTNVESANLFSPFPSGKNGTSLSAPIVSGAVARALEKTPTMTPAAVESWLTSNSTKNQIKGLAGFASKNRLLYVDQSSIVSAPSPTMVGTEKVGQTLKVLTGTWDAGTSLTIQWNKNGAPIAGATTDSLILDASYLGSIVSVTVTGTNQDSKSIKTSLQSGAIALGELVTSAIPVIAGEARVGKTLNVDVSSFPSGSKLSYVWLVDGFLGPTHNEPKLTITPDLVWTELSVKVTAEVAGYNSYVSTSETTSVIEPGLFEKTAKPNLKGTFRPDTVLEVDTGMWDEGVSFVYQWLLDDLAVDGEESSTFVLGSEHIGSQISLEITGTKEGYESVTEVTDVAVEVLPFEFEYFAKPIIRGLAKAGQKLTAFAGEWETGTRFTYQWTRNGRAIFKATKSTYILTKSDVGTSIGVRVTGELDLYETKTLDSSATKKVVK